MASAILPPAGDPARQATGAYSGFTYQAWQAADAWLRLGLDDVLFLEHAEDFDVATEAIVESTQVKGETGELTLGRKKVREAIAQYRDLRERNPDRTVTYRYLTTRTRGFEAGRPFGERTGLDVWDGARRSDDDLRALRDYLADQELPRGVLDLVASGTGEEVRAQLVHPIHWDTAAPDAGAVKRLVEERLIEYGDGRPLPVPASVSRRVASAVFTRVAERSSEAGPRRLMWADFVVLFEEETMEPVLAGATAAQAARAARTPSPPSQAGDPGFLELVDGTRLPVVVARDEIVETVRLRARDLSLSVVVGSSGVGKTVLAELAAGSDGGWYRVDLRGLTPDGVARRLDDAALALAQLPDGVTVLLDDYSVFDGVERVVTAMGRLLTAAGQQAIHIVVTAQSPLPTRVTLLSPRAGEDVSFTVPMLTEDELAELAEGDGCPPALTAVWARVLDLKTSGHPQLASAYAAGARARGWPEPEIEDVVGEPVPIAEVRAEARATLREVLRGADAFDLVRRLSVFTHPFTRSQALRLAAEPPPLGTAALDLDALVGPWIEAVSANRYRMSPLLAGLYRDTLVHDDQKKLHAAAADALVREAMSTGSVDAYDLSAMLSHSALGDSGGGMAFAASIAKTATDFARVADYLDWFAVVATGDAVQALIPSSPAASLLARDLQFRVALKVRRDLEPVLDAWEAEIDALEATGEPVIGHRLLLAMSVLMHEEAVVSIEWLVRTAAVVLDLPEFPDGDVESIMDRMMVEHGLDETGLLRAVEASGRKVAGMGLPPSFIFNVLASRPSGGAGVAAFVEAAVTAPAPVGSVAQEAFSNDVSMTESVTSKPWMKAKDAGVTDWDGVLSGLDMLVETARRHGLTALTVSVERTRAVVLYEEVENREAAENALNDAAGRLGDPPRLREYRGKILRMEGEFEEALAFYEELLPQWDEDDPNTSRLYAYHDVIEAAGIVGAWDRAAYWAAEAEQAAQRLSSGGDNFVELCYAVDGAIAEFKTGRACDAIARLRGVVMRLSDPSDPRIRMFHRRVAHVTAWIHGEVGGLRTTGLKEPSPGMASRFDSDPDGSDVPVLEPIALLAVLGQSAVLAGCEALEDASSLEAGESLLSKSMRVHRWLTDGIRMAVPDLPDRYVETIAAAERAIAEREGRPSILSPPDIVGTLTALTYGAIVLIAQDPFRTDVLEVWSDRLRELFGQQDEVEQWQSIVETSLSAANGTSGKAAELTLVVRNGTAPPNHRLIAAAALARASQDPDTRMQALVLLAASASAHPFGIGLGAVLAALAELDVPPGQGVREAARAVLDHRRLNALRLAPQVVAVLRAAVDQGPRWGLGNGSTTAEVRADR